MSRTQRRRQERAEASERAATIRSLPERLAMVPIAEWPPYPPGPQAPPKEVWTSKHFVVQVYDAPGGDERISVQRTSQRDGITWDELQEVKHQVGRGHRVAVEVYPPNDQVVNVANMRHLWTLPTVPAWAWRARP